jgi:hypothetical protein
LERAPDSSEVRAQAERPQVADAPLSVVEEAAMSDPKTDRAELQRRLDLARCMAAQPVDALTRERLDQLVRDIEAELAGLTQPSS